MDPPSDIDSKEDMECKRTIIHSKMVMDYMDDVALLANFVKQCSILSQMKSLYETLKVCEHIETSYVYCYDANLNSCNIGKLVRYVSLPRDRKSTLWSIIAHSMLKSGNLGFSISQIYELLRNDSYFDHLHLHVSTPKSSDRRYAKCKEKDSMCETDITMLHKIHRCLLAMSTSPRNMTKTIDKDSNVWVVVRIHKSFYGNTCSIRNRTENRESTLAKIESTTYELNHFI